MYLQRTSSNKGFPKIYLKFMYTSENLPSISEKHLHGSTFTWIVVEGDQDREKGISISQRAKEKYEAPNLLKLSTSYLQMIRFGSFLFIPRYNLRIVAVSDVWAS